MAPISAWKVAYRAAALEPKNALPEKSISAAQEAMMARLLELINTQENKAKYGL
jgi:hypothetical protein